MRERVFVDERDRAIILARRKSLVIAALASAGLVASTPSCGGDTDSDKQRSDASAGGTGGTPAACLGMPYSGGSGGSAGTPQVCLEPPYGGSGGTTDAATDSDAPTIDSGSGGTQATDSGSGGAAGEPQPCLKAPYDGG